MNTKATKNCIACASEINENAIKCIECGSYQGKRRFLTFSTTVISLLIALLSIIGIVAPILKNQFAKEYSQLEVTLLSADTIKASSYGQKKISNSVFHSTDYYLPFSLLIENTGTKPGVFDQAEIIIYSAENDEVVVGKVLLGANKYSKKIPLGEIVLINGLERVQVEKSDYFPSNVETSSGAEPNGRTYSKLQMNAKVWNYGKSKSTSTSFLEFQDSQLDYFGID